MSSIVEDSGYLDTITTLVSCFCAASFIEYNIFYAVLFDSAYLVSPISKAYYWYLYQHRPQTYHRSVAFGVDGYGNASFVLRKSILNNDFHGIHLVLVQLIWISIVQNSTILLFHKPIRRKIGYIVKDNIFGHA